MIPLTDQFHGRTEPKACPSADIMRAYAALGVDAPSVAVIQGRRRWCATVHSHVALIVDGYGATGERPWKGLGEVIKRAWPPSVAPHEWTTRDMERLQDLWPITPAGNKKAESAIPDRLKIRVHIGDQMVCLRLPVIKELQRVCRALRVRTVTVVGAAENKAMVVRITHNVCMLLMPALVCPGNVYEGDTHLEPTAA